MVTQKLGDVKEAIKYLKLSNKHFSKSYLTHYHLGLLLKEDGNLEEGIKQLNKAVELNPELDNGYYYLARFLEEKEEFDILPNNSILRQFCFTLSILLNPNLNSL